MVEVPIRPQHAKPPDSEKLTVNLGFVDLGSIDLLVRDGFYSNRSDFIRTAVRNQLATHADTAKQAASRLTLELGLRTFARQDLEAVQAAGERLSIRVLGLAVIADDVNPRSREGHDRIDHRARGAARAGRGQNRARRSPALSNSVRIT
jgi:Arc/MetJ-type ribon-helix-helix transcriptional regulator